MLHQVVVTRIGSTDRFATDRNCFSRANVLVGKGTGGRTAQGDRVTAQGSNCSGARQGGCGRRVVDLVASAQAGDQQIGLADICTQSRLLQQGVVASIGAAERDAGDGDGFAGGDILVGKRASSGTTQSDGIASEGRHCCGAAQGCDRAGVVDLVAGSQASDGQVRLADVRCRAGGGGRQVVVACIRAAQCDGGDVHCLAGVSSLVTEVTGGCGHVKHIAAQFAGKACASCGECGIRERVVHLVARCDTGHRRDVRFGNVGGQSTLLQQVVVVIVATADQTHAGDGHGFAIGCRLVCKRTNCGATQSDGVTGQGCHGGGAGQGCGRGGVINLVAGSQASDGQISLTDVSGQTRLLEQVVVVVVATTDQTQAGDGDGLGRSDVLVGKRACGCAAQSHGVTRQGGDGGGPGQRGNCVGVVYLVAGTQTSHAQVSLADIGRQTGLLQQVVVTRIGTGDGFTRDGHGFAVGS